MMELLCKGQAFTYVITIFMIIIPMITHDIELMVLTQHDDLTLKFSSGFNEKKRQQIDHHPNDWTFVIRLKNDKLEIKPSHSYRLNITLILKFKSMLLNFIL